jgi:hypothetical protein
MLKGWRRRANFFCRSLVFQELPTMRYFVFSLPAALLGLFALGELVGEFAGKDEETKKIEALVKQLGDDDFARRDAAVKELDKLGDKALAQLREAAAGEDAEVRWRAQVLIGAPRRKSTSTALELVLIPAGDFRMGSPVDEPSRNMDETLHSLAITKPFYLGVYEVTQQQFRSQWQAGRGGERDGHAVIPGGRSHLVPGD